MKLRHCYSVLSRMLIGNHVLPCPHSHSSFHYIPGFFLAFCPLTVLSMTSCSYVRNGNTFSPCARSQAMFQGLDGLEPRHRPLCQCMLIARDSLPRASRILVKSNPYPLSLVLTYCSVLAHSHRGVQEMLWLVARARVVARTCVAREWPGAPLDAGKLDNPTNYLTQMLSTVF